MHRIRLVPLFALFVFAALCPIPALALTASYEGVLQPDGPDPPIPIVVELREAGGIMKGSVKTSSPLQGNALIRSGGNVYGRCTIEVVIAKDVTLRLDGTCEPATFNGTYMLRDVPKRKVTRGDFRLERNASDAARTDSARKTASASSCLKANTQCLAACPRGDPNVEFMCSNRCRTKFKSCKGTIASKPLPESP